MTGVNGGALQSLKIDLNIEAPFIKIVQECIVKTFKSHKKFIEKEVSLVVSKINSIKKAGSTKGAQSVVDSIDQLITKLNQLKSRYNKMLEAEDYLFQVMKKRLQHLNQINENYMNNEIMKDYFSKRLNRIIIDYLLRESYFDSAKKFIEETGLKDFVDLEVFEETNRILSKLKQRDCQEALNWCNTHKTKLQKMNSQLEFKLRVQEFIQFIKENQDRKAIEYSKAHLRKFDQDYQQLQTIQKNMGLLFLPNDSKRQNNANYKNLTDEKRWDELQDLFMKESYQLFSLPQNPMINQALQTGIPVLKTEFCMKDDTFKEECPTCNPNIRKLGQKLPFSHQTQTCITCTVTGEIMNDQNQPYFLPTGHIVSERAIKLIKDPKIQHNIICPVTNQSINQSEVRKVYFS